MKREAFSIAISAFVLTIFASANVATAEEKLKQEEKKSGSASALTVVVDKETGELVPASAEQASKLTSSVPHRSITKNVSEKSGIVGKVQYHANGVRSMVLDPSMLESVTAIENPDGSLKIMHGDPEINHRKSELPEK